MIQLQYSDHPWLNRSFSAQPRGEEGALTARERMLSSRTFSKLGLAVALWWTSLYSRVMAANEDSFHNNVSPIRTLGPDDEVDLSLSCSSLFKYDKSAIKGVFGLVEVNLQDNWLELTTFNDCRPDFAAKCEVLGVKHLKVILGRDGWSWANSDSTAASPRSRIRELNSIGCLQNSDALEAFEVENVKNGDLDDLEISKLKYWTNLKPEVLDLLIDKQKVYGDLPIPMATSGRYLRLILESGLFRTSRKLNWAILDSSVMTFVATRSSDLGELYVSLLTKVVSEVKDLVEQAVISMRMEAFLKLLLVETDRYPTPKLALMVGEMSESRKSLYKRTKSKLLKTFLIHRAQETTSIIEQFFHTNNVDPKLVQSLSEFIINPEREEENLLNSSSLSFKEFSAAVNNRQDLPQSLRESWLAEFLLLYPVHPKELEQHQTLIGHVFSKSLNELSVYLGSFEDVEQNRLALPTMAFKLCTMMLRAGIQAAAGDCVAALSACIGEDRPNLRYSVLGFLHAREDLLPTAFALVSSAKDLSLVAFVSSPFSNPPTISLDNDQIFGFNVEQSLKYIMETPDVIAHDRLMIKSVGMSDAGGPLRQWISKILMIIHRKLMVPLSSTNGYNKKFSWAIHRDSGLVSGVMFGKAFQKNIKLPFALDGDFYDMIAMVHPFGKAQFHEEDIQRFRDYFRVTYQEDLDYFLNTRLMKQWPREVFENVSLACVPLEEVKFTTLLDRTNVIPDPTVDVEDLKLYYRGELTFDNVEELYYKPLIEKVEDEFVEFMKNFIIGFGKTFYVSGIRFLSDINFMKEIFDGSNLTAKEVEEALKFESSVEPQLVPSLIPGALISLRDVLISFLRSLNSRQLAKMVAVWTGAPDLILKPNSLIVHYVPPSDSTIYTNYFWMTDEERKADVELRQANFKAGKGQQRSSRQREENDRMMMVDFDSNERGRNLFDYESHQNDNQDSFDDRMIQEANALDVLENDNDDVEGDGGGAGDDDNSTSNNNTDEDDQNDPIRHLNLRQRSGMFRSSSSLLEDTNTDDNNWSLVEEEDQNEPVESLFNNEDFENDNQFTGFTINDGGQGNNLIQNAVGSNRRNAISTTTRAASLSDEIMTDAVVVPLSNQPTSTTFTSNTDPSLLNAKEHALAINKNGNDQGDDSGEMVIVGEDLSDPAPATTTTTTTTTSNTTKEKRASKWSSRTVITDRSEFMAVIREMTIQQAIILNLNPGEVKDPFEAGLVPDGLNHSPSVSTCGQVLRIPTLKTAGHLAHALIFFINSPVTDFYDPIRGGGEH